MIQLPPSLVSLLVATAAALLSSPCMAGRQERVDVESLVDPVYAVDGDAFVRHNGDRYCNRPLYCRHIDAIALAGDKPFALLASGKNTLGCLVVAFVRDGRALWLQDASDITSRYHPGRMEWIIRDKSWGETVIHLELVPFSEGAGMALKALVTGSTKGDEIIWASGGVRQSKISALWEFDMTSQKNVTIGKDFLPAACSGNEVQTLEDVWILRSGPSGSPASVGDCGVTNQPVVADGRLWKDPLALRASKGSAEPVACGSLPVVTDQPIYWSLRDSGLQNDSSAEKQFGSGVARAQEIEGRVSIDTPDAWLNAAVGASVNAMEGCFRKGMFTHAGMRWGVPLLGWRTLYGGTVYGSHDEVLEQAGRCLAAQIKTSDKIAPHADPATSLSSQAPDSRMFGKGRVDIYQPHHYDMQSQFFDQLIHAWRWTGDPELEKLLSPALDLHCDYIRECFDPSGKGIYESYANSWPTDDQWFNGGGTPEETAYAYTAERNAAEIAARSGNRTASNEHKATAERIKGAFLDLLWIKEKGHPGAYREQGGLERLHESAWLNSIFCPIDAGLLNPEESAQAIDYTSRELERIHPGYGGEQCWPSNWLPSVWSVREMWPGDNYHLALACFQTGLPEEGWKLLRGTFPQQMLFGPVPGDMGHAAGATDFNDCNGMFARAVVEGLFGYVPDYPNGRVRIRPGFPDSWNQASITTRDFSLSFQRDGNRDQLHITLTRKAVLELSLRVRTKSVRSVMVNGHPSKWNEVAGFGATIVKIDIPETMEADIRIELADRLPETPRLELSGKSGESLSIREPDGKLVGFHDPQGVLHDAGIHDGTLRGILTKNEGAHLLFGLIRTGTTLQWRRISVYITDPEAELDRSRQRLESIPQHAIWEPVSLDTQLNADVRDIFRQQYLSPRPNTCSLRLATDGCSTWQMILDKKNKPPEIDVSLVSGLKGADGLIRTALGVPFLWPEGKENIAFTSLWDNWPHKIDFPVKRKAEEIWFLVCGSTNPMQVRIPNARIRIEYDDGKVEILDLIPPFNFWSLCPFGGIDYDYNRDAFSLPKTPPATLQLGKNCRAIVLGHRLRTDVPVKKVTLEAQSQEVVIGLIGMTLMNPH
jgi:hypothetical protein